MPNVEITEKGCRGCTLCIDICPVDVFENDAANNLAKVKATEDCIGCLSCTYVCPSGCINISDVHMIKPFHRIEDNVELVNQFLQTHPAAQAITSEEMDQSYHEVGILLTAFAEACTEVFGRGHKSIGRRAGTVAASHMPEMYEENNLEDLLEHMRKRFGKSFDFNFSIKEQTNIDLDVQPCGLLKAVQDAGEKPGDSVLCLLFHEYWAGLISSFTGKRYSYDVHEAGPKCAMTLRPAL